MARVEGKVVFITGGAGGVGRAVAAAVLREGGRVALADLDAVRGAEAVQALGAERSLFVKLDVTNEASWAQAWAAASQRFGKVDALVNSAAVLNTESIEDTSLAAWQRTLGINADGVFLGCKQAVASMKSQGGAIVNIASTAAVAGHPGMCAYTASKGAVTALTRHVAAHCRAQGYRIRCNSILPAGIRTPMTASIFAGADPAAIDFARNPASGVCEAEDVAAMVLYLVSDESRFVNGADMRLDNALLIAVG